LAQFPDGVITVEATVPEINEDVNRQMSGNEELIEFNEALTPADWSVEVWRLPKLGPNDSKRGFKQLIRQLFADLPAQATLKDEAVCLDVESDFDGELSLTLKRGRKGKRAATVRGMVTGADNTEERIRAAIKRKKKQLKKTRTPVLLAVRTDAFGDMEDYDQAVFGLTCEHVDHEGRTISTGFNPMGLFAKKRREPPTYAGLLAYTAASFPRVNDPVLYIHQGFDGVLPELLRNLEVRTLEARGFRVEPARVKRVLAELNLVY
jgi:hypothetical protein